MNEKIENISARALIVVLVALVIFFNHIEPIQTHPFIHLLQKGSLLGAAAALFLNIRYGFTSKHYALSLLFALLGLLLSLFHASYHICPETISYGDPFLHFSIYTWWSISFFGVLTSLSLLLCFHKPHKTPFKKAEFFWLVLVILATVYILK